MAKYKLWLTIKNNDGSTKEICAGDVDLSLDNLTDEQAKQLADRLDPHLITEEEYDNTTFKYTDFELKEEPKEE
jgi:hypothetical protein